MEVLQTDEFPNETYMQQHQKSLLINRKFEIDPNLTK